MSLYTPTGLSLSENMIINVLNEQEDIDNMEWNEDDLKYYSNLSDEEKNHMRNNSLFKFVDPTFRDAKTGSAKYAHDRLRARETITKYKNDARTDDEIKELKQKETFLEKLKRIAIDQPRTWISRKIAQLHNWATDMEFKLKVKGQVQNFEGNKLKRFWTYLKEKIVQTIKFLTGLLTKKEHRGDNVKVIDYTKNKTYDRYKSW